MTTKHLTGRALLLTTLGAVSAPALAIDCDELRSSIDARIRATGVSNFSLSVVAASAPAPGPGSVVGSCDLGSKKIVYTKAATPKGTKPTAAVAPVITECDDGERVTPGACRK